MRIRIAIILSLILSTLSVSAQQWVVETEPGGYVSWLDNDTVADIYAPKGLTMWNSQKIQSPCRIEYEARIVGNGRVSDLNCFWMASDPEAAGNVFTNMDWRGGRFVYSYSLNLYYVGYGGNNNSTTRFRRYMADSRGIDSAEYRPAVLKEYVDSCHLLRGDHWYHIRIENEDGHVRYYIDGECLVDYIDPTPLREGYFGFRTTQSHCQLRQFHVTHQ